jgi:TM2 domain-containing membrane protein YozV
LKQAGIGLAIIGLSWLIVSVIFRLIGTMWGGGVQQTTTAMLIHTLTALV